MLMHYTLTSHRKMKLSGKDKNDFIIKLLELALRNNSFEFDLIIYRQIIGTAMGSGGINLQIDVYCIM